MLKKFVWLLATAGSVLLCYWVVFSGEKQLKSHEIIKFSHKYHQKEVGNECTDCHAKALESTQAVDFLVPTMADCGNCHDVENEEECTVCHFEDEATWLPFPKTDRGLIFNHQQHSQMADVNCETCHANLAEVDFSNAASMPGMVECGACHTNKQATLECASCHVSTLNLRPTDHTSDFLVTHKNIARIDEQDCVVCHTQNDCAECHEGATLVTTVSGPESDIFSPMFPSVGGGTRGLLIPRIHDPNFRFTHPLQAEGRTGECAVCHETRNFCQDCHEAQGIDVAGKPLWHGGSDWGALAGVVGTGGGRHAELAKRDIENCASCHNTQGDDPTCLLCHTDFDGVKGTNPRTHETGFANRFDSGSDFHTDETAICYSCHTGTDMAGIGFCGYCHGPR